jgi:excisionase family DNA binding protein
MQQARTLDLLATKDAAKILDRSEASVRLYAKAGRLQSVRLPGGQRLFHRSDVERLRDDLLRDGDRVDVAGAAR